MFPRIKSGIQGLDSKIRGGIPENSITLLYSPPKAGKSIFSYQFFFEGLRNEEPGLFITTEDSVDELKQNLLSLNMSPISFEENGFTYYVDLFSIRTGNTQNSSIVKNISPEDMSGIIIGIGEAYKFLCPKSMRIRTVFDGITTLIDLDPAVLNRVLRAFIAKSKAANSSTIISYTEGTAEKKTETMLKALVDNIVYLDGKGSLVVESMIGTPCPIKTSYSISDTGITVKGKN